MRSKIAAVPRRPSGKAIIIGCRGWPANLILLSTWAPPGSGYQHSCGPVPQTSVTARTHPARRDMGLLALRRPASLEPGSNLWLSPMAEPIRRSEPVGSLADLLVGVRARRETDAVAGTALVPGMASRPPHHRGDSPRGVSV